jgi:tetratricopeptide (TPR) repeat protein
MTYRSDPGKHPDPGLLERFMRNEAEAAERKWVVRHLIAGCARCLSMTSGLWVLADPPASLEAGVRGAGGAGQGAGASAVGGGESEDGEGSAAARARKGGRRQPPQERDVRRRGETETTALFGRLADASRRIEAEREQAPRLAAELLASLRPASASLAISDAPSTPTMQAIPGTRRTSPTPTPRNPETPEPPEIIATLLARPAYLTPAVCEVLLEGSRREATADPALALRAAELALAVAERLDPGLCGATVRKGLRVRAWAHVAQGRRLSDDLEGAEWALALAESLALEMVGIPGIPLTPLKSVAPEPPAKPASPASPASAASPATPTNLPRPDCGLIETAAGTLPFVPGEWAELLVFKAGLFADRGDLSGADRLLGRAAGLFQAGGESQRTGRTLVQQGMMRADLGDHEQAAKLLRAGVDLLDPAADPGLVAANLYRLAVLLRGIALAAQETSEAPLMADTGDSPEPHAPHSASRLPSSFASRLDSRLACDPVGRALPAQRALKEALRLVRRARTLYRSLGDAAAEAHLTRLQGQIEAALGNLEDAEATLLAATAALAEHGCGREATLAQIELALVLIRQGRAGEVRGLGRERWPLLQARDKSWEWVAAVLVFQVLAASIVREQPHPTTAKMLGELVRYLAHTQPHDPHDPRRRRLERVA